MSRPLRQCLAALLLPCLLATAWTAGTGAETPRLTAGMSLEEFARSTEGKEFYGAYLFGHKIGWISDESRVVDFQGIPVLENVVEMHMSAGKADKQSSLSSRTVTRYALRDGAVLVIEATEAEDKSRTQRIGVRDGEQFRVVTREQNGKITERVVPAPLRAGLRSALELSAWLAKGPRKGERFETWEVDLSLEDIEDPTEFEFIEPSPLVWGGVPIQASRVKMRIDGPNLNALVGPDGKLLNGRVAGLVEIRAEEEATATVFDGSSLDMLAASSIQVSAPLGDRDRITGLWLELSGLGEFELPASARQRVKPLRKGRAQVQLSRETPQTEVVPLTERQRMQFLRSTPSVQSDDADIVALARSIVGSETDPLRMTGMIVDWIDRNLSKAHDSGASTATTVLAQRSGDCTEHALLFTALARAAGIPARQVGGIIYVESPEPLFGWHAWAEIHDGRGWVTVDPTWRQVRVDPTHVQFTFPSEESDADDYGWVQVLGKLKIKVTKVEQSG